MSIRQLTRKARRPQPGRPWIVDVTNTWRTDAGRLVVVQYPDGRTAQRHLPDEHPALVRYLDRLAAAAA